MNADQVLQELQRRLSKASKLDGSFSNVVRPIPIIKCANGVKLSVQASSYHYCSPRTDDGPYISVEVGFPSVVIPEFIRYAEEPNRPTETVYGRVPIELVAKIISNFGGFSQK